MGATFCCFINGSCCIYLSFQEPYKEEDMDDSEVDEESDEFTSDESSENNDEGSDDPEYDPKFHVEDFRKSSSRKPKRRKTF